MKQAGKTMTLLSVIVLVLSVVALATAEAGSGARLVMARAAGIIRGQVSFAEGAREAGRRYTVFLRLPDGNGQFSEDAEVDGNGRFLIDGIPSGEYELMLVRSGFTGAGSPPLAPKPIIQRVSVQSGAESHVQFFVKANPGGR